MSQKINLEECIKVIGKVSLVLKTLIGIYNSPYIPKFIKDMIEAQIKKIYDKKVVEDAKKLLEEVKELKQ